MAAPDTAVQCRAAKLLVAERVGWMMRLSTAFVDPSEPYHAQWCMGTEPDILIIGNDGLLHAVPVPDPTINARACW